MNKSELISVLAKKNNLKKSEINQLLDTFFETVIETVQTGENVKLVGFGTFSISQHSPRQGYNPTTKERMNIPAKKIVRFKSSRLFKVE